MDVRLVLKWVHGEFEEHASYSRRDYLSSRPDDMPSSLDIWRTHHKLGFLRKMHAFISSRQREKQTREAEKSVESEHWLNGASQYATLFVEFKKSLDRAPELVGPWLPELLEGMEAWFSNPNCDWWTFPDHIRGKSYSSDRDRALKQIDAMIGMMREGVMAKKEKRAATFKEEWAEEGRTLLSLVSIHDGEDIENAVTRTLSGREASRLGGPLHQREYEPLNYACGTFLEEMWRIYIGWGGSSPEIKEWAIGIIKSTSWKAEQAVQHALSRREDEVLLSSSVLEARKRIWEDVSRNFPGERCRATDAVTWLGACMMLPDSLKQAEDLLKADSAILLNAINDRRKAEREEFPKEYQSTSGDEDDDFGIDWYGVFDSAFIIEEDEKPKWPEAEKSPDELVRWLSETSYNWRRLNNTGAFGHPHAKELKDAWALACGVGYFPIDWHTVMLKIVPPDADDNSEGVEIIVGNPPRVD